MSLEKEIERTVSADNNNDLPDVIECTYAELYGALEFGHGAPGLTKGEPRGDSVVSLERAPNGRTYRPMKPDAEKASDCWFEPDPPIFYEDIEELAERSESRNYFDD